MSKVFNTYKLGEITNIFAGGDLPNSFSTEKTDLLTIPVYSNGEKNNGLWGYTDKPKVTDPAVTISARGSKVGFAAIRKQPYFPIVRLLSLIPCQDILDVNFLFYNLKLNRQSGIGSGQPQITIPDISDRTISVPSLDSQQKIASVLTALDLKIEHNNRINAELEAMAKTVYDYWFVQFDFPVSAPIEGATQSRTLNNQHTQGYKSSGGKMVWCEELKREVPKGWEVKPLEKIIETIIDHRGKTPLKLGGDWAQDKNGIIALSAKHVKGGKLIKLDEANVVTFEMFEKWMSSNKLQEGDILMTSEAPCGEFYLILKDTDYCLSQRLFAIRANQSIVKSNYLYFELSKGNGYSQILGKQSGSTVFGIRQDELRTVNVLIPDFKLQELFQKQVTPMLYQIRNNEQENQQLSSLRDWLLPMLMNGQVSVGDIQT